MDLQNFLNKSVIITTVKDSKYKGTVTKITTDKFHLNNLIILHKDGSYKAVSGEKTLNKRWFNIAILKDVKED